MSIRCEQVSNEIKHLLSEIIIKYVETVDYLITITNVEISPDLKYAKAFITIIPENKSGSALNQLKKSYGLIQKHLKSKIRFYTIPKITFNIDEGDKKRREINDALDSINK
ncbi:MAG: 30S ribosome-binding factor RbfA [Patescibacteria group bacterium]|nr:30S ribosome-binding factor RbfA [Patescibacteria group bacterium]MDD4303888.1 30S ribosome-binding factor RbfA [Patescibacteria group bacterium]MDD4695125.1 30S ribosome-binding factor RbfA [Patescibacteria group bacterium]